jgi:hypothetical protein
MKLIDPYFEYIVEPKGHVYEITELFLIYFKKMKHNTFV